MQLDEKDIRSITESIWATTLGLYLARVTGPSRLANQPCLTGMVSISGAWHGLAAVQCSPPLARRAAMIMFNREDPADKEVEDALGELANMTGGNIKPLLPGPSELSLPSVVRTGGRFPGNLAGDVRNRLFFESDGEPLEILLLERSLAYADATGAPELHGHREP